MDYDYRNFNTENDYGNGNYNNSNNNQPFGGPYGQKPPYNSYNKPLKYPKFIPVNDWKIEKKRISRLGIAAAVGIFAFILMSNISGEIYYILKVLLDFDTSDGSSALYVYEMVYTVFCVGLPFYIIYTVMKKHGYYFAPLPLEKPKNMKLMPTFIVGGVAICFLGDIVTSVMAMFSETISKASETSTASTFGVPETWVGIVLMILSNALMPALIEELTMRGIVMQPLRRYGDEFAIIVSSVIFGMLHCNLAQIPFAVVAGCVLGYVTIITDSLWPSIIIHFINNGYSVLVSILSDKYGMTSVPVIITSGVIFYGVIAVGVFMLVTYYKKPYRPHIRMSTIVNTGKNYYNVNNPYSARVSYLSLAKAYFISAPMITALIIVLAMTITSLSL